MLLLNQFPEKAAEQFACARCLGRTASAEQGAQEVSDITASGTLVFAEYGEQIWSYRSQDVGNLIVGGVGLGGESGNYGGQVATEDFAENLCAVFQVDAERLASVVAQSLGQSGSTR